MFTGFGTALITPFKENGDVDYAMFEKIIDNQLENGVNALVVLGTTGESPTVHFKEREELTKIAVKKADGEVPVIVGTGTNDTSKVLEMNKLAEQNGADGLLIVTPYYNKTSQAGLIDHYTYIAARTELPIIAYNVPSRTGVNIEPATFRAMSEQEDNIIAVKEASGDMSQILEVISQTGEDKIIYSGNDDQAMPIMMSGGSEVIPVFSNLLPGVMKDITENILAGEYQAARDIFYKYHRLMRLLFVDVNPIPVKFAMSQIGLSNNNLRKPLIPLSDENQELLLNEMRRLEII